MAITVSGLSVRYKKLLAVDDISFSVVPGEIFGVIGPNGAGKTSTIECIEGLRQAAAGEIRVLGIDPCHRRELYRHIGVQLQEAFYPSLIRVEELCQLFSSFYSQPLPYMDLLERFELGGKAKARLENLSGGQRSKVSIVLALLGNPQILFLDELTTGLDPHARKDMWELVKSLKKEGKTVFMTTHYMEEAEYLCDRVCMLVKGRVVALGSPRDLVARETQNQIITFTAGEESGVRALGQLPGVSSITRDGDQIQIVGQGETLLRDVVVWLADNKVPFNNFSQSKTNLEDVYLRLAGESKGGSE